MKMIKKLLYASIVEESLMQVKKIIEKLKRENTVLIMFAEIVNNIEKAAV